MSAKSKIQWCDATINPCYGCTPVSPACENCYAARMAHRLGALTEGTVEGGKWTGHVNLFPERMEQALRWRRPRKIFIGSMTDIFHESVPDEFLNKILGYMAAASWHTFILLTKRPERMREYFSSSIREKKAWAAYWETLCRDAGPGIIWPLPNVILMATVEDQPRADERIHHLVELATMGWRTGISVEPMLGAVDLTAIMSPRVYGTSVLDALTGQERTHLNTPLGENGKLSWVICGGESGPGARPMHPDWARSLRDQCKAAGVPFFFKSWGEWGTACIDLRDGLPAWDVFHNFEHYCAKAPTHMCKGDKLICPDGHVPASGCREGKTFPMAIITRIGKRKAGRLLDGVEHNAFPEK